MEREKLVFGNKRNRALAAAVFIAIVAGAVYEYRAVSNDMPRATQQNIIQTGEWSYMPGVELKPDGLHITHRDFRIVEQDGSGGQPNPPVNEYGTHLDVPDDFTLRAKITNIKGSASLQFYASPPLVSDEFRVEPKSIRLTFSSGNLTVSRWDDQANGDLAHQAPVAKQSFALPFANELSVTMTHANRSLALEVNGQQLGTVPAGNTFEKGSIWFGANAETAGGHFTFSSLQAEAHKGGEVLAVDTSETSEASQQADGLQVLAQQRRDGFLIGADAALWAVTFDPEYRQRMFGGNFGVITPENEMKWQFVQPQPGIFDFRRADALVAEAKKHDMKVHGHNLVFGEALPRWLQDMPTDTPEQKAKVRQVLITHVSTLVSHFKGSVDEWDINEVFADYDQSGNLQAVFRDNVFYRAMGADYIHIVAEAAQKANPNVKIWLNDYGIENDTGPRWQAMFETIKKLKQGDVPIYGVGFQSHIYDTETDLIVDNKGQTPVLTSHIQELASINVMSRISEMDAPLHGEYNGSSQSKQFVGVVNTCIELPSCKAISFWSIGPTDRYQDENHRLQPAETDSPFGPTMIPTETYYDLQKLLR